MKNHLVDNYAVVKIHCYCCYYYCYCYCYYYYYYHVGGFTSTDDWYQKYAQK